ncbi:MAG TPA: hydantoinase/oxoprolinase family protein [Actinomycetota bacterium]|nr:hydantoinase/oxoprolinase family protein [Actinomycetota bacterium]
MAIRIGVDVGGTFTKAVACDDRAGEVIASVSVPTTHHAPLGVSEGVVAAAEEVKTSARAHGEVAVIAHSTTQAVNALLEGDTARVGVIGIGARPDLRRAAKRTRVGDIAIAPGRGLETIHEFMDATNGLREQDIVRAVERLQDGGAEAICVSQAFGVEDTSAECTVVATARRLGLPSCAGHELTGLYGLEMRTVTGAVNASILPTALATAGFVEEAFSNGSRAALMVMRGDGGAADLRTMRRHPLATAFSGPAASVAGALRQSALRDGIVVEVGGTSTNVSPVRGGRPVLSYIRVLEHVTCIRSLDARVAGIGGGSLIRATRRRRGLQITDVGPRSAHIADLEYCAYTDRDLSAGSIRLISPRPGDPEEYVVLELPDGERFAVTPTCAANALEQVPLNAYARTSKRSARVAFEVLGRALDQSWEKAARAVLDVAAKRIVGVVREAAAELELDAPLIVGVGGGAGSLVPTVADQLRYSWSIPEHAEVISSIGDALSLVRTEVERTLPKDPSPDLMQTLHRDAEQQAVRAGAAPESLQVTSEVVPERRAVRAVAIGSVALQTGVTPTTPVATEEEILLAAKAELRGDPLLVGRNDFYSVFTVSHRREVGWTVIDLRATPVATEDGQVLAGTASELAERLPAFIATRTKHLGPVSVAPHLHLVLGATMTDLSCYTSPSQVLEAAQGLLQGSNAPAFVLLARS